MKYMAIFLMICIFSSTNAQVEVPQLNPLTHYKVTIRELSGKKTKGYLSGITDSLVIIYAEDPSKKTDDSILKTAVIKIPYQNINDIWFSRKGRVPRNALKLGLIFAGVAVAATITPIGNLLVASSESESSGSRIIKAGIRAGLVGAIVGGLTGVLPSRYFTLQGSKDAFDKMVLAMRKN